MTNLPDVIRPAFPDRPTAVTVISQGEAPSIVRRLKRVNLADETVTSERERYAAHTPILNPNEKAAVAAYSALEEGRVLIDLYTTLTKAITGGSGSSNDACMSLGIAHPSMKQVYLRRHRNDAGYNTVFDFSSTYGRLNKNRPLDAFYSVSAEGTGGRTKYWYTFKALTPPIPPEVRAQHPAALKDKRYLLLWEAEWSKVDAHQPRPPMLDPALLYQVSGSIYAVVAVWDLTPIEAAALRPGPKF